MSVQQDYFNTAWPLCLEASAECSVRPEIIFAQSALETGYGLHHPANNYFGIKAGPSTGVSASTQDLTTEYINGVARKIQQHFAGYPTMASSFLGYATFLRNNRRYKTFESGGSLSIQLMALGTSGYATDPNYAVKIGRIVDLVPGYLAIYSNSLQKSAAVAAKPIAPSIIKEPIMTETVASGDLAGNVTVTSKPAHETGFLADVGHDVDEALNPVKSLVSELTAHKTGLQVAINLATSLLPYAPIPAAAATAATDILNGLSGLANKPIPATATTPAAPAPAAPVVVAEPLPTAISEALEDGEQLLSTLGQDFLSGNLSGVTIGEAFKEKIPTVVEQVENAFNPGLGIAKNPNAN